MLGRRLATADDGALRSARARLLPPLCTRDRVGLAAGANPAVVGSRRALLRAVRPRAQRRSPPSSGSDRPRSNLCRPLPRLRRLRRLPPCCALSLLASCSPAAPFPLPICLPPRAAVAFNLLLDDPDVLAPLLLGGTSLLLLWTLLYRRLIGVAPCCQPLVVSLHVLAHAAAAWAALCCLLELRHALGNGAHGGATARYVGLRPAEALCALGWALLVAGFLLGRLYGWAHELLERRRWQHKLESISHQLLALETQLCRASHLVDLWTRRRRRSWRRTVAQRLDLPSLVRATLSLEQHVRTGVQTADWLDHRAEWQVSVPRAWREIRTFHRTRRSPRLGGAPLPWAQCG